MAPNLADLFRAWQKQLATDLGVNRDALSHPTSKGDATEDDWAAVLAHLPERYRIDRATVIDSKGGASDVIDLVVYDRQYSPLLFKRRKELFIPAESVYAVFEVRQELSKDNLKYAAAKVASVRRLQRTSVSITHAGGIHDPRPPIRILGGILTGRSSWKPPFGDAFREALRGAGLGDGRIDVGCALEHGGFEQAEGSELPRVIPRETALAGTLLTILQRLQSVGTVPAMDLAAYSQAFAVRSGKGARRPPRG